MAYFAHAYSDENGKSKGGKAGDQKDEIRIQPWYIRPGGWEVCLVCEDPVLAELAAKYATQIAKDQSFGYDQSQRQTGADAIKKAGSIAKAADSELDCSSLIDLVYELAGLEIERGYTGNLERRYMSTGLFIPHREPEYLKSGDLAPIGSIYLTSGKHVAIVVDPDVEIEADYEDERDENEDQTTGSMEADQIDPPYVEIFGSVNVRDLPGYEIVEGEKVYNGKSIYLARNTKLPFEEYDDDTGWYGVLCPKGPGFVSNAIPRYAKLILE